MNHQPQKDKAETGTTGGPKNGIVTVNDGANPSPDERDALIGQEEDTERLRSERESVQEATKKD